MRIVPNSFAIFWSSPKGGQQFHADVFATSPAEAVAAFRALFPTDTIHSCRASDGRFQRFTQ